MPDVYPAVIAVMATAFRALGLRITVTGDEQVPTHGPVVLASNHSGYSDFALLGLAARRSRRHVRFLARYDVWDSWFAGPFMRSMRHIPVDRAAPAAAILTARTALRRGEAVGVFPESGVSTSFTIRPVRPGAVALALATGAPLLPVVIWVSQRIYTVGHRLDLTHGRPIRVLVDRPFPVRAISAWWTRPAVWVSGWPSCSIRCSAPTPSSPSLTGRRGGTRRTSAARRQHLSKRGGRSRRCRPAPSPAVRQPQGRLPRNGENRPAAPG
ncbi:MAG: 1-acyl-sn-glycerol-3-phosphate acyltransferase [Nocardioidaceae bacterium]|nr:1-acyl-sn-glycerol-3-phosphate acyltransferase [Nocardioidaceae bacterium]